MQLKLYNNFFGNISQIKFCWIKLRCPCLSYTVAECSVKDSLDCIFLIHSYHMLVETAKNTNSSMFWQFKQQILKKGPCLNVKMTNFKAIWFSVSKNIGHLLYPMYYHLFFKQVFKKTFVWTKSLKTSTIKDSCFPSIFFTALLLWRQGHDIPRWIQSEMRGQWTLQPVFD